MNPAEQISQQIQAHTRDLVNTLMPQKSGYDKLDANEKRLIHSVAAEYYVRGVKDAHNKDADLMKALTV